MILSELYDAHSVPEEARLSETKPIMFLMPSEDYDLGPHLHRFGLSRDEVCATWPKVDDGNQFMEEARAARAKVVVQVGGVRASKKYSVIRPDGVCSTNLPARIKSIVGDTYVNLHHHDEFSLRDSIGTVKDLAKLLEKRRQRYCTVTNHGSVGGWIKQYSTCKKAGLKPIFGMEAYVNNCRSDDPEERKANRSNFHLILLARNETGFYNLIKIHNDAQLNGFYYRPRVNHEAIRQWGKGIIGSSACMAGEIPQLLMEGKEDEAREVYEFYRDHLDAFYIEITLIEMRQQVEVARKLVEFAHKVGAPLIVTCDSHYLLPEHCDTHDILLLIKSRKTVNDRIERSEEVWQFDARNLYYRNEQQMWDLWRNGFEARNEDKEREHYVYEDELFTEEVMAEAILNTRRIAASIEDIELDSEFKLPKLYDNAEEMLASKAQAGFRERGLRGKVYHDRLNFELKVICDLGFADYFLTMDRIISDTKAEFGEWAVGYGRGSAAGSLVSYCLGLTDLDPIQYKLLFERFLDYDRKDDCPDIDTDFDPRVREWVKEHIVATFGEAKTCSIGTYQTYKTRAVVIDVARALGLDVREAMEVTKKIDALARFDVETDDGTEEQRVDDMEFEEICKHYPELYEYFKQHPEVLQHAEVLRNQVKNMGKHAGGVIISNLNLQGRIPVIRDSSSQVVSAWSEGLATHELTEVGLVKFDILGLNTLCIISDCLEYIRQSRGKTISREDIPLDDHDAIKHCSYADLVGIFQFENPATKPIVDDIGMESIFDISAITSLIRPGPKDMGMHEVYAQRKKGEPYEVPACLHSVFDDTYGIVVYQEQIQQVATELAGFDPIASNRLRKALIKEKNPEVLEQLKTKFIDGAQPRVAAGEVTQEEVVEMFDRLHSFAKYGFNRAHAMSYSAVTSVELWLKYHYPTEFLTALLNNTPISKKKFGQETLAVEYITYARRRGIRVLPPSVNKSGADFRIEDGSIRYSLGHIKNIGASAAEIESLQPFESFEDFFGRINKRRVNKRVMLNLIAAGAFSEFGTRNEVLAKYCALRISDGEKIPYMTDEEWDVKAAKALKAKKSRETLEAKQETIGQYDNMADFYKVADKRAFNKNVVINLIAIGAFNKFGTRNEVLEQYFQQRGKEDSPDAMSDDEWVEQECDVMNICLSRPPLIDQFKDLIKERGWCPISQANRRGKTKVFGRIADIVARTSRRGMPMLVVEMTDDIDSLSFFVFDRSRMQFMREVEKGNIVAMPLDRFKDGDTRFFDVNGDVIFLKEKKKP